MLAVLRDWQGALWKLGVEVKATLTFDCKLTIVHDGTADCMNQSSLVDGLKSGVKKAFRQYNDDIDFEVDGIDVYIREYIYEDDAQKMKEELKEKIEQLEPERLAELLSLLK